MKDEGGRMKEGRASLVAGNCLHPSSFILYLKFVAVERSAFAVAAGELAEVADSDSG